MNRFSSFFLFFLWSASAISAQLSHPCLLKLSVDIKDGVYLNNGTIMSNNVSYPIGTYFKHNDSIRGCICKIRQCVHKCCEFGQAMVNKTCQIHTNDFRLPIHDQKKPTTEMSSTHFHYIIGNDCGERGFYRLSPTVYKEDEFYIQRDGNLFLPQAEKESILAPEQFCLEKFVDQEMNGDISALVCFAEQNKPKAAYKFDGVLSPVKLISVVKKTAEKYDELGDGKGADVVYLGAPLFAGDHV